MKIYEKHNNFSRSTLMSRNKEELVNYALMMQKNLINMQNNLDVQYENSKKMIEELEERIELIDGAM